MNKTMMTEKKIAVFTMFPDDGKTEPVTILMTKAELEGHIRELQSLLAKEFGYN